MNKEEKTPYLVENEERDTFTFYVKGTKPYIELKQQITQLTNNWNELEEFIIEQERINNGAMKCGLSSGSEIEEMGIQNDIYDAILDKMKEIKENNK